MNMYEEAPFVCVWGFRVTSTAKAEKPTTTTQVFMKITVLYCITLHCVALYCTDLGEGTASVAPANQTTVQVH